jgi:hypothetical protein
VLWLDERFQSRFTAGSLMASRKTERNSLSVLAVAEGISNFLSSEAMGYLSREIRKYHIGAGAFYCR